MPKPSNRPRSRNAAGAPWSAQVELAEGCNRLCDFCGLASIRKGPGGYKFMSEATARAAADGLAALCPAARVEFAMHGEPLMHPGHLGLFSLFRAALPDAQVQVTTNGRTLMRKMQARLEALFAHGIDFVVLDTYYPERDALRAEAATLRGIAVRDFYDDLAPKGLSPWHNHRRKWSRLVVLMDDLGARDGEVASRVVLNHAGNVKGRPVPAAPLRKTCTNPFREVAICWDGTVNLCCMDWGHEYRCGNVNDRGLAAIWHGPEFQAARAMLAQRDRSFSPCARCDKGPGARAGLLPPYDPPTPDQAATLRATVAAGLRQNGLLPILPA